MIRTDFNFLTSKVVAGAAWSFTETLSDYPADEYDLKLLIKKKESGSTLSTFTATADGTDFLIEETAVTTAALTKGWYVAQMVIYLTGTDTLEDMLVADVYIDKLLTSGEESRTDSEIILDTIIATLKSSATREQGAITTPSGTQITYRSLEELENLKDKYQARVNRERAQNDGTFTRTREIWLP